MILKLLGGKNTTVTPQGGKSYTVELSSKRDKKFAGKFVGVLGRDGHLDEGTLTIGANTWTGLFRGGKLSYKHDSGTKKVKKWSVYLVRGDGKKGMSSECDFVVSFSEQSEIKIDKYPGRAVTACIRDVSCQIKAMKNPKNNLALKAKLRYYNLIKDLRLIWGGFLLTGCRGHDDEETIFSDMKIFLWLLIQNRVAESKGNDKQCLIRLNGDLSGAEGLKELKKALTLKTNEYALTLLTKDGYESYFKPILVPGLGIFLGQDLSRPKAKEAQPKQPELDQKAIDKKDGDRVVAELEKYHEERMRRRSEKY